MNKDKLRSMLYSLTYHGFPSHEPTNWNNTTDYHLDCITDRFKALIEALLEEPTE